MAQVDDRSVVEAEVARPGFVAWDRTPRDRDARVAAHRLPGR